MTASQVLGIILAIALIVFGIAFPTPEKYLHVREYNDRYSEHLSWDDSQGEEYVGGDAYNYQMEASLKAGYMSGVLAMKSITFASGLLLLFLTLYSRVVCAAIEEQTRERNTTNEKLQHILEEQTRMLSECAHAAQKYEKLLEHKSPDNQKAILDALCPTINKRFSPNEENNVKEEM